MRIPNGAGTMKSPSMTSRAAPGRIVRAGALAPTDKAAPGLARR